MNFYKWLKSTFPAPSKEAYESREQQLLSDLSSSEKTSSIKSIQLEMCSLNARYFQSTEDNCFLDMLLWMFVKMPNVFAAWSFVATIVLPMLGVCIGVVWLILQIIFSIIPVFIALLSVCFLWGAYFFCTCFFVTLFYVFLTRKRHEGDKTL